MEVERLPDSGNADKYESDQSDCGERHLRCEAPPIGRLAEPQFMPTFPVPPKPNGEDWNRYKWFKEPAQPYLWQSLEAHEIRCDVKDTAQRQVLRDNAGKDRKEPDDKLANQVHAGECTHIFDCGIVIEQRCYRSADSADFRNAAGTRQTKLPTISPAQSPESSAVPSVGNLGNLIL